MSIYATIVTVSWIAILVIWFVAALRSKKNASARMSHWWFRLGIIIVIIALTSVPGVNNFFSLHDQWLHNPIAGVIGDVLCVVGIVFAIWARAYLGKNWGMPMSVKESPELVTTGPYRYVRHPIYTGIFLALIGSGLVIGSWYLIVAILVGSYFVYSATVEEKNLVRIFGEPYVTYQKRSKMVIPFIL